MDWTSQIGVESPSMIHKFRGNIVSPLARVIALLIFGPPDTEAGPVWLGTDRRSGG